jgi:hypothetical protein
MISRLLLFLGTAIMSVRALVEPTEIYTGGINSYGNTTEVALRIATGGAGQSGLVKGNFHVVHTTQASSNTTSSPRRRVHPRKRSQRLPALHHRLGPQRHNLHHQKPRDWRSRPRHLLHSFCRENCRRSRHHRLHQRALLPLPRPLHHHGPT